MAPPHRLVHGLSDTTHSMRPMARILLEQGYQTLNLREDKTLRGVYHSTCWGDSGTTRFFR